MASMLMMRQMPNTIMRSKLVSISKPHSFHSYSSHFSRVSFTSSSKIYQNPYPREDVGGEEDAKAAERIREARQVYEDKKEDMKEGTQQAKEKLKEGAHRAEETMQEAKENVKEGTRKAGEKLKEGAHKSGEKTKDSVEWTAEKTKEGAGKVAEAMQNVGDKAKETAKGAWETAKDATRRMKETVVGEDEEDKHASPEDYIQDKTRKQGKHGGGTAL